MGELGLKAFLEHQKSKQAHPTGTDPEASLIIWKNHVHQLYAQITHWLKAMDLSHLVEIHYHPHQVYAHGSSYTLDKMQLFFSEQTILELIPKEGIDLKENQEWVILALGAAELKSPYGKVQEILLLEKTQEGKQTSRVRSKNGTLQPAYLNIPNAQGDLAWFIVKNKQLHMLTQTLWEQLVLDFCQSPDYLSIREQAESLARSNKQAEPEITDIYWFPSENQIRLIELEPNTFQAANGKVEPFYFGPVPLDQLYYPSAIALIRPEEFGVLQLPEGWGTWDDAQKLVLQT